MGRVALVWSRERDAGGVLGVVWVRELHLDPRRHHQLVAVKRAQLRPRGRGLRLECGIPGEKPVACGQCDRSQDQSGVGIAGCAAAFWLGGGYQDNLLCVSLWP